MALNGVVKQIGSISVKTDRSREFEPRIAPRTANPHANINIITRGSLLDYL